MLKLTGQMLDCSAPFSAAETRELITTGWNTFVDTLFAGLAEVDDQAERAGSEAIVRHTLWESWARIEAGESGLRAMLYGAARTHKLRPINEALVGAKDSTSRLAYAFVAQNRMDAGLVFSGEDPAETVRKSIQRFKSRMGGDHSSRSPPPLAIYT